MRVTNKFVTVWIALFILNTCSAATNNDCDYKTFDGACITFFPGLPTNPILEALSEYPSIFHIEHALAFYAEYLPIYASSVKITTEQIKEAYKDISIEFVPYVIKYNGGLAYGLCWEDGTIEVTWFGAGLISTTAFFHELNHAMDAIVLKRFAIQVDFDEWWNPGYDRDWWEMPLLLNEMYTKEEMIFMIIRALASVSSEEGLVEEPDSTSELFIEDQTMQYPDTSVDVNIPALDSNPRSRRLQATEWITDPKEEPFVGKQTTRYFDDPIDGSIPEEK